ncbi:unnamed protein product, partial [Vitis vinifera]
MAMRNFYNEIRGLKVKELPAHVKPMFTIDYIKKSINKGLDNYHANTSSTPKSTVDPDIDLIWCGFRNNEPPGDRFGDNWCSFCFLVLISRYYGQEDALCCLTHGSNR